MREECPEDDGPRPAARDWCRCNCCGAVTTSPYRVNPLTGLDLRAGEGGYCPGCYEDACRRAQRDGQSLRRTLERLKRTGVLRRAFR